MSCSVPVQGEERLQLGGPRKDFELSKTVIYLDAPDTYIGEINVVAEDLLKAQASDWESAIWTVVKLDETIERQLVGERQVEPQKFTFP